MATPQEKLIELPYGVTGLTDVYGIVMRRTDEYYLDASDGSLLEFWPMREMQLIPILAMSPFCRERLFGILL